MPLIKAGNQPTWLQRGYPEDRNKCGRYTLDLVEPDLFCFHFVHFKSQFYVRLCMAAPRLRRLVTDYPLGRPGSEPK